MIGLNLGELFARHAGAGRPKGVAKARKMRRRYAGVAALTAGVGLAALAMRATAAEPPVTAPPNYMLFGTIAAVSQSNAAGTVECSLPTAINGFPAFASASAFRQDAAGVHIEFVQPVEYYQNPLDTNFGGWALLTFKTATTGIVTLDKPAWTLNVNTGSWTESPKFGLGFSFYTQSYNATTGVLTVSFRMGAQGCVLPITAVYHNFGQ